MGTREPYNVVVETAYGPMIVNRNDYMEADGTRFGVGWDLMQTGRYVQGELDNLTALIGTLGPDPVLLDIGANIGVHSLLFSRLAGPRGRVHAFEAQRIVYQMLMGNLALNSIENVHASQVALGAAPGTLRLPPVDYASPWNFGGLGLTGDDPQPQFAPGSAERAAAEREESIEVRTLDQLNLPHVHFAKIDVEGMEVDVLRGGLKTLERDRPLMQVEWLGRDAGALPEYLIDDLGYRVYQAGLNLLCIPVERTDFGLSGLVEITLAALHDHYGRS